MTSAHHPRARAPRRLLVAAALLALVAGGLTAAGASVDPAPAVAATTASATSSGRRVARDGFGEYPNVGEGLCGLRGDRGELANRRAGSDVETREAFIEEQLVDAGE